ncbi:MAG: nitroreductase family protein [Clostridia bacterium]|nr:nitroreductase family protein [Clostridia bacterium]
MELLEIIKKRRSIRKYTDEQIPKEHLEKIIEAGLCAPNAGGRQGTVIVGIHNKDLTEIVGKLNLARFDRGQLEGSYVSKEQPSIIDNPNIKSGFYGAPSVCIVFAQRNFLYSIPDAFCAAENMVLQATELGVSSCIIARGEETFDNDYGNQLLNEWGVPENYIARCFVILGYIDGEQPHAKPLNTDRYKIIG